MHSRWADLPSFDFDFVLGLFQILSNQVTNDSAHLLTGQDAMQFELLVQIVRHIYVVSNHYQLF